MTRIYFNRCFNTTSELINQLLQNPQGDSFDFIISHSSETHYLQSKAIHFEIEPNVTGKPYAGYILTNIVKHHADIFIPRYNVTELVKEKQSFDKTGVKAMFVTNDENYQLIENKVALYEDLKSTGIIPIPDTHVVSNLYEFQEAYNQIKAKGWTACYKPIQGIGGIGFKRIRESIDMKDELFLSSAVQISKERVEHSLSRVNSIEPFMMSGFMEGYEYSIDCLAKDGELLLAVPRRKIDKYRQVMEPVEELIEIARKITRKYTLSYLYNIQVKYHEGVPYLIEINTRISGGMYKNSAVGVNMLYEAVRLLQGKEPTIETYLKWNQQVYDHLTFGIVPAVTLV